jgi:hypothetical protein
MTRRLPALVVLACLVPARAGAQRIERFVEQVAIAADGSARVTVDFDWPAAAGPRILLPVASAGVSDVRVTARQFAAAAMQDRNGRPHLAIDLGGGPLIDDSLHVTFTIATFFDPAKAPLAHGIRRVRYEFVNTTDLPIGVFRGVLVLPAGTIVASVGDIAPDVPDSAVASPYTLGRLDGHRTVALDVAPLGWSETAAVTVEFRPDGVPVALLAVFGAAALGYLYRFRDLIRRPDPGSI